MDPASKDANVQASEARVDALIDQIRARLDLGTASETLTTNDLYDPETGLPA